MARPSATILSSIAAAVLQKDRTVSKVFPFPKEIGVNGTRIARLGEETVTRNIKYCSVWSAYNQESNLYVCGHFEGLSDRAEARAAIMYGLHDFRSFVGKGAKLDLMVAGRLYDDKLSTMRDMVCRNQEACISALEDSCYALDFDISPIKIGSIGGPTIMINGIEIEDITRYRLFKYLLKKDNSDPSVSR